MSRSRASKPRAGARGAQRAKGERRAEARTKSRAAGAGRLCRPITRGAWRGRPRPGPAVGLALWALVGGGCWEQVSPEWFAQMKEQPAVQALEGETPRVPPDGTIPVGGIEARIDSPVPAFMPQAMALPNPVTATPRSVERGEYLYGIYCAVCHGDDGKGDLASLPVAKRLAESGAPPVPLQAVPAYTDGFLFTKIRYGKPVMPGYPQIPARDRWHIVNYLRVLVPRSGGAE